MTGLRMSATRRAMLMDAACAEVGSLDGGGFRMDGSHPVSGSRCGAGV